jgi:hypothetical protein
MCSVFFAILALVFPKGQLYGQDEGFLGFRWGTPLREVEQRIELTPVREEGDYQIFTCDLRSFEKMDISSGGFEFVQGRLVGAFCETRGTGSTEQMTSFLTAHFGAALKENARAFQWFGRETHASFDADESGDGYVYCYSLTLAKHP